MEATGFMEYDLLPGYFPEEYYAHFGKDAHAKTHRPQNTKLRSVLWRSIDGVLNTLTDRERTVIMMRWGLGEHERHSLKECAQDLGCTKEGIRHIEIMALRKMRHPSRRRLLDGAMEAIHEHEKNAGQ